MNMIVAFGAGLAVPLIVLVTLAAERRADRWFQRVTRWFTAS